MQKGTGMFAGTVIRKNQYYDSVFLMGINDRLMKVKGVTQTAVLMATDSNKEVLAGLGFTHPELTTATPNDLVVAVIAETQKAVDAVLDHLDEWLTEVRSSKPTLDLHTLAEAITVKPQANLVVVSVPGEYAAHETRKSLEAGMNVFLFSDNVSIEDEVSLKQYAQDHGLIVMGPDCGTSILGGVGVGFANVVRRGKIGVIGAAGTGLQEFTSMVHNSGYGISHALGTGSRDLSDMVGAITTLTALTALEKDPNTEVITILSKPAGVKTLSNLVDRIKTCKKPVIVCFLGIQQALGGEGKLFQRARTIDEAVARAIRQIGGDPTRLKRLLDDSEILPASEERKGWRSEQKYLRGIFAGGTFCYQTQQILQEGGIKVYSNAPLDKAFKLEHPDTSREHTIVDMGDDFYMVGKLHPMIDSTQRRLRIIKEAHDPEVAVLLLDFILGYNSSMDPVGELIGTIHEAQQIAIKRDGRLTVVTSICGTDGDPQDLALQTKMLKDSGAIVFHSNARAAEFCACLLREVNNVR